MKKYIIATAIGMGASLFFIFFLWVIGTLIGMDYTYFEALGESGAFIAGVVLASNFLVVARENCSPKTSKENKDE